ncbi:hypothetical protein PAPYR_13210 [Paratrimastix pyriformis]|uniref:BTB domain-containing protein n=1 Tax=Paratrimastix pyriformis TaxID=342808 RepID=A0ABQ8U5J2_9EUKA|nr:hypothetical protein PAPYR_13210 [Paratrimastix pyriformis]
MFVECPVVSTLTADLLAMTDDWATADSFIACPASHAMVTAHGSLIRIRCKDLVPFLVPRRSRPSLLPPVSPTPSPSPPWCSPPATAAGVIAATAVSATPGLDPPIPSSCIVNCPPEALAGLPDCEIEAPLLRYLLGFLYADHIPPEADAVSCVGLSALGERFSLSRLKLLAYWRVMHSITRESVAALALAARAHKLKTLEKNLTAMAKQLGVAL